MKKTLTIEDCTCNKSTKNCKFHKECIGVPCAPAINICDNPEHNTYRIAQQERILEELRKYWRKNQELRLGQLIANIMRGYNQESDPFYLDDAYLSGVLLRLNNEDFKEDIKKAVNWRKVKKETFNEKVARLSKEARR
jgi:hypothetical protein